MHEKPSPLSETIIDNPHADAILAGNGFSLVDYASRHIVQSRSFRELDLSDESFFDSSIESALHPADRPNLRKLFKSLQSGADGGEGEFRFLADDGSTMWLALSFHVITREENGALKHLVIHDDNIIEHLHRIIPFDRASVQTLEGNILSVIGGYGYLETDFGNLRFSISGIDNPSARAIASRRPIICNDVEHDFEGFIQVEDGIVVKSWLGIPLVYEGRAIGLFALDSAQPGFYTEQHVRLASNVAEHIAMAIAHAWQHTMVKEEARTDKLTGIGNRYGLETREQEIFGKAAKDDEPLGALMIDIDHFKAVNDNFGHAYGDNVLRVIAAEIQQNLRIKDYPVRYGGEEFVILLPDTSTREDFADRYGWRAQMPDGEHRRLLRRTRSPRSDARVHQAGRLRPLRGQGSRAQPMPRLESQARVLRQADLRI